MSGGVVGSTESEVVAFSRGDATYESIKTDTFYPTYAVRIVHTNMYIHTRTRGNDART